MIQGTSSGAGKTTLVTALCRIFSKKGYRVVPFKSQNMSNYSYKTKEFEISRAQAIQAVAARTEITPDINPILLKPLGNYQSLVFLHGKFYKKMHATKYYQTFALTKGLAASIHSLNKLQRFNDFVIIEGAGSPSEINLSKYDIANMRIAEKANSPVLLVTDIDRGGSFASIVGTMALLEKKYRHFVKGFVINKFRGDLDILKPAFQKLKKNTGRPILGTIPLAKFALPEEDSLGVKARHMVWNKKNLKKINSEIDKLSKLVEKNLNIKEIERLIR
jgi:adenosylcobyric acid synthase